MSRVPKSINWKRNYTILMDTVEDVTRYDARQLAKRARAKEGLETLLE